MGRMERVQRSTAELHDELTQLKAERDEMLTDWAEQRGMSYCPDYEQSSLQDTFFTVIDRYLQELADRLLDQFPSEYSLHASSTFTFCFHCLDSLYDLLGTREFRLHVTEHTAARIRDVDFEQVETICTLYLCYIQAWTEAFEEPMLDESIRPTFVDLVALSPLAQQTLTRFEEEVGDYEAWQTPPDELEFGQQTSYLCAAGDFLTNTLGAMLALDGLDRIHTTFVRISEFAELYLASLQQGYKPRLTSRLPERVRWLDPHDDALRYRTGNEISRLLPRAVLSLTLVATVIGAIGWGIWTAVQLML